jgi:hypothetical protein
VEYLHREMANPTRVERSNMPYTYEKASVENYDLIKEGEYEAFVEKALIKETLTGKQKIALQFRIRSDVNQESQNRVVFEDIWKERENPQFFNRKRINQILGTQHFEDGKSFETVEKLLEAIIGANLIIKIGIEHDDYRNADVNHVVYYKSSKQQPKTIGSATKAPEPKEIADEDLPF